MPRGGRVEMDMRYDILLDIGGTGIKGGYHSIDNNAISDFYEFPSNSDQEKEVIIQHISHIAGQIWDRIEDEDKRIRYIKMAFPGPFDYSKGVSLMKGLAKYESLYQVSIPAQLISLGKNENYSFIPQSEGDFKFVNDVEAYARGVMYKRKLHQGFRAIYLCIGTGAGSAYSINGQISTEHSENIPENGWIYPIPYKASIIDDYISVRGINKLARKYCNNSFSPLELSKMATLGNSQAINAYKEFGEDLSLALLPLLTRFQANTFVIGGNISRSSELFLTSVEESCKDLEIDVIIESDTSRQIMIGLTML
jgi:glucokinase